MAPAPAPKPVPTRVRTAATVPASSPAHTPVPATPVAFPVASSVYSKAQERLQHIKPTTKQIAKKNVGSFLIKLFNRFHIGSHAILLASNTGMVNWVIYFIWCSSVTVLLCACKQAVPLQAWSGPEGSRKLGFPDFVTMAQDGGKVVSLMHRQPYTPRKCSWYSFLLEVESTPGP